MAEETLEEAAKRHADSYYNKNSEFCSVIYESVEWINRNHNFIVGAEWQAERMYSEDDLVRFMQFIISQESLQNTSSVSETTAMYYIEQFKKK